MPAYFNLSFEIKKEPAALTDFYQSLLRAGLVFKSGYWGFEDDSFNEIVGWNQKKLDADFVLGYTTHHSHDYKQMLFDDPDFSEMRLFVLNERKNSTFFAELVIPEYDLAALENNPVQFEKEQNKMERLEQLARAVWEISSLLTIQTGWECSDFPPRCVDISEERPPQTEPFSIIPLESFKHSWEKDGNLHAFAIGRNGLFLKNEEHWFPC